MGLDPRTLLPVGKVEIEDVSPEPPITFRGPPFTTIFFDDQSQDKYRKCKEYPTNGATDVIIMCSDGHFGIHRMVLLSASEFARDLLAGVIT